MIEEWDMCIDIYGESVCVDKLKEFIKPAHVLPVVGKYDDLMVLLCKYGLLEAELPMFYRISFKGYKILKHYGVIDESLRDKKGFMYN